MQTKSRTGVDACLHFLTGMAFSIAIGFGNPILQSFDLSSSTIGLLFSLAMIGTIGAQYLFSFWVEEKKRMTIFSGIRLLSIMEILFSLGMLITHNKWGIGLFFVGLLMLATMMLPALSALTALWLANGYRVSFGPARAMLSIGFSCVGFFGGFFLKYLGGTSLLIINICVQLIFILGTILCPKDVLMSKTIEISPPFRRLFQNFPNFNQLMIGTSFLFFSHNLISNFLKNFVDHLQGTPIDFGITVGLCTLFELPTLFLFAYLYKRYKACHLLICSGIFLTLKVLAMGLSTAMWQLWLAQGIQIGAYALYTPAVLYYVMETIPKEYQVRAQLAIGIATMGIGGGLGNFFGGYMIEYFDVPMTAWIAVGISAIGALFFLRLSHGNTEE